MYEMFACTKRLYTLRGPDAIFFSEARISDTHTGERKTLPRFPTEKKPRRDRTHVLRDHMRLIKQSARSE